MNITNFVQLIKLTFSAHPECSTKRSVVECIEGFILLISAPFDTFLQSKNTQGERKKTYHLKSKNYILYHKYSFILIALILTTLSHLHAQQLHIGLCIVATGKYISFVKPLLNSAEKYFCPNHQKSYFIFTDANATDLNSLLQCPYSEKIIITYQKKLGWPYDTLMRFAIYNQHKHLLYSTDYIFATDADMLFVGIEGDEILGDLVATNHPGFEKNKPLWGTEPPYDRNPQSTAYIPYNEGTYYFAGGFYGGTTHEFIKMTNIITHNILTDLNTHNYIALWHDESHLNRYFIDHKPNIILDRSYCYPENGETKGYPPCNPKLLALDKNHAEIRE